jgi:hypothetical protein
MAPRGGRHNADEAMLHFKLRHCPRARGIVATRLRRPWSDNETINRQRYCFGDLSLFGRRRPHHGCVSVGDHASLPLGVGLPNANFCEHNDGWHPSRRPFRIIFHLGRHFGGETGTSHFKLKH